jgi:hypothetical protein
MNLLPLWDCKQYSVLSQTCIGTPHLSLLPLAASSYGTYRQTFLQYSFANPSVPVKAVDLHDNESGQSRKAWSQTVLIGLAGVNQSVPMQHGAI